MTDQPSTGPDTSDSSDSSDDLTQVPAGESTPDEQATEPTGVPDADPYPGDDDDSFQQGDTPPEGAA